ncbi:MAG: hypothetical protein KDA92_02250 [Planctomycetales bacterium]|nr:hypothetical protein [Planctomycetales bacterium]
MSSFDACIALGPIAVYLLLIGRVNLTPRPFVTTGLRDTLTLMFALAGLAIVGPLRLFMPTGFLEAFGGWTWLPMIGMYCTCGLLASLLMRPRIVIYNVTVDQLRPLLEQVASQLDAERRWAGASLLMPNLGVQFAVEPNAAMRNVQLVAVGGANQDLQGWRRLDAGLRAAARSLKVEPNPRGISFLVCGVILAAVVLFSMVERPQEVAQGLHDFLSP